MTRPDSPRTTRWVVVLALVATALSPVLAQAAGGGASTSPCPTTPEKCYSFSMSVSPSPPEEGELATYTATLHNLSRGGSGVTLGSANITWSPADALTDIRAGSVSPRGTETISGTVVQLRDLSAAPGEIVTATWQARAVRAGTITFDSTAKQANDYRGLPGNDLTQVNADPTTSATQRPPCRTETDETYGCQSFPKATGGTLCTGTDPSHITACFTIPPLGDGVTGDQLIELSTSVGGETCAPTGVSGPDCTFVSRLMSKLASEYTAGANSATMTINCGSACGSLPVQLLLFGQNEETGNTHPLLPCPIDNPLDGGESAACATYADGQVTASNITYLDDYKVMGFTV